MRTGFPDFTARNLREYRGDDFVISRWRVTGTHDGLLESIDLPATGKEVEFEGVTIYEFEDDIVTEAWWYSDMIGLLTQLGVIPEM